MRLIYPSKTPGAVFKRFLEAHAVELFAICLALIAFIAYFMHVSYAALYSMLGVK